MQIDLFILHGFPQAFDEDVIAPAAFAIHADLDVVLLKHADERRAGELAALIGVHDFRRPVFQKGLFQRLDARIGGERMKYSLTRRIGLRCPTGTLAHQAPVDRLATSCYATVCDGVECAGNFLRTGLRVEQ